MAKKRSIGVRLSHQRIEALMEICRGELETFLPQNDHQFLLREYLTDLEHKLVLLVRRPQEYYTLSLSGTEAIAFHQLWQMLDIRRDKYAAVIVETMLKKISSIAA